VLGQDQLQGDRQSHRGRDREPVLAIGGAPPRRHHLPLDSLRRRYLRFHHLLDPFELVVKRLEQFGDGVLCID
jgi:hypothetical protein